MAQLTALQLHQAGFSSEQILGYLDGQRKLLKTAGFSDVEINDHYGLIAKNSQALHAPDFSLSETDVYEQHNELGKKDNLIKNQDINHEDISHNDKSKARIVHQKNEKVTLPNLALDQQQNVFELIKHSEEYFKNDEATRVGFVNTWLTENYPDLDSSYKDFNTDLSVVESSLNDSNTQIRTFDEGEFKNKYEMMKHKTSLKSKEKELVKEQEKLIDTHILNTPWTTGYESITILKHAQNMYNVSDTQLQYFNEALSFIASIESDNKNIMNARGDSSAAGYFQLTKGTMKTALQSFSNIMHKYDKNWQFPKWMENAFQHLDMTRLTADQQRALALVNLIQRNGSDDLIKTIMTGNTAQQLEALKELYKVHHYVGKITKENEARIEKYFNSWGTARYGYMTGQMAFFPSTNEDGFNNPVSGDWKDTIKFVKDLPYYAAEAMEKLNIPVSRGHYNVFTNGYMSSVNGLFEHFHEVLEDNPDMSIQEAYQKVFMWQEQSFGKQLAMDAITLINDLPWMIGGCVSANVAAGAVTGGVSAVASPVICGAGAFAVPEMLRDAYMRAIEGGEVNDVKEFLKHFFTLKTAMTGTKASIIGGATLGVGSKVQKVIGTRLGAGTVKKGVYAASQDATKLATVSTTGARLSSEITTMVTLGALLEGQLPTKHDFAHAAVLIFGLHGAMKSTVAMRNIYRKFSIHPKTLVLLAKSDPIAKEQLKNGDIPDAIIELNEKLLKKHEQSTSKKLLPIPKYHNNETIKISPNGADTGKIIGKEVQNGENILIVEKPNGQKVSIKEHDARKVNVENTEAKINKSGKIEIDEAPDKDFIKRQENGEFDKDIIEVTKDETGIHTKEIVPTFEIGNEIIVTKKGDKAKIVGEGFINKTNEKFFDVETEKGNKYRINQELAKKFNIPKEYKTTPSQTFIDLGGVREKIVTKDNSVLSDGHILMVAKYYPKMAKFFEKIKTVKRTFENKKEILDKVFKGLDSQYKKISIVFAVNKGASSKVDILVGRVGKEYVSFSRKAYNSLIKFVDTDGQVKNAKLVASNSSKPLVFLHPTTNKVIGLLMTRKIEGELKTQAQTYFRDHKIKEDMDGMHYDRVNSTRDGNSFEVPPDPYNTAKENYGYKDESWKRIYNNAKGLDLDSLIDIVETFIHKSPEIKNLSPSLRGYFQFKGKNAPRVVIAEKLQKMPKGLYMTLAHEIGHLIDYLPNKTLARGNILGSLATLKKFMNEWLAGKNDGAKPLSKKEIDGIRKRAEEWAEKNKEEIDKAIKTLEITPETILKIFQDAKARENINPEFYDAFAKLAGSLKKLVIKDAMKGLMSNHLKAIADKINGKKVDPKLSEEANKKFKELFERELKERGLVNKEWIMQELKHLTMLWKPFNVRNSAAYTKYRYSPRELFADFMMVWLLKPEWVKINTPRTFETWIHHVENKPELKKMYENLQFDFNAGKADKIGKVISKTDKEMRDSNEAIFNVIKQAYKPDLIDMFQAEVMDVQAYFYRRNYNLSGWNNRWHSEQALKTNVATEAYRYRTSQLKRYSDEMNRHVAEPIVELGFTLHEFGTGLMLRNLYESNQRKNVVTRRFFKLDEKVEKELLSKFEGLSIEEVWTEWAKRKPDLVPLMDEFFQINQRMVVRELEKSGIYDDAFIELIKDNYAYITYDVVKHLLKRVEKYGPNRLATAHIGKTKGTFNIVRNPFEATVEKGLILITEAKRHEAMRELKNWLIENKTTLEKFKRKDGSIDRVIEKVKKSKIKERPPEGMEEFFFLEKGELQLYYVNKWVASMFKENPVSTSMFARLLTWTAVPFKKAFTELNPPFWPVNFIKDATSSLINLPNASLLDIKGGGKNSWLKYLALQTRPSFSSVFKEGTELTRWMEEKNFLIATSEGYRGQAGERATRLGMDADTFQFEKFLHRFQNDGMTIEKWDKKKQKYVKVHGTLGHLWHEIFGDNGLFGYMSDIAKSIERIPKVAGTAYLLDAVKRGEIDMGTGEMMIKIQADIGSPAFLRHGRWNSVINNLWLYSNPFKEGWRRNIVRFKEAPASVAFKFFNYSLLPKILMKAMEKATFGVPLAVMYLGINKWDKENYITIPISYTKDGRVIYFRIPQEESARLLSTTFYKIMSAWDDETVTGEKDSIFGYLGYLGDNTVPQMNPIFNMIGDLITWMSGNTPHDDWKGTPAVDRLTDKANDDRRTADILKWFMNTYTGQGFIKFDYTADQFDKITEELDGILGFPVSGTILSRFIKIGNHPAAASQLYHSQNWDQTVAQSTLDAKIAISKIMNGEGDKVNGREMNALALKWPHLATNSMMIDQISRILGADVILAKLAATTDVRKRFYLLTQLANWERKVGVENPE